MRKNKRKYYARFAIHNYYMYPDYTTLNTILYIRVFDYRFRSIKFN